jgi:hypothetical protein
MKAQALEVSDDQVIAQALKVLRASPLHSHLVSERPKIASEIYEQFAKFSKFKIQHFHKLELQRKFQSQTKPQDLTTMKVSAGTLSLCTKSTLMDVDHWRIGRRIMGHPRNKQTRGPPTRDLINTADGRINEPGSRSWPRPIYSQTSVLHVPR